MSKYQPRSQELIILTEHFTPSTGATAQLATDLVDDLHKLGVRVFVLTSTPGPPNRPYPIKRFSRPGPHAVGILGKVVRGLLFFLGSLVWLIHNTKKTHSLFIISNPPFIGLIGLLILLLKKVPYIFLLQDVFPRSASLTGILPAHGPLVWPWRSMIKATVAHSRATIVLSEAMSRRSYQEYGASSKLFCIPNWSLVPPSTQSKSKSPFTSEWGIKSLFTIQYSGNFGRLHEILIILEAARLLQDHPIKFVFVGGGAKANQLYKYCSRYNLPNVLVKPYQSRDRLASSLSACDLSIVSMAPGAEDTVAPSKFYGIIASSRPVLLISSHFSELSDLISKNNCGVVVESGDVLGLSQAIYFLSKNPALVSKMSNNAFALYTEVYGRARSVSKYYRLFKDAKII